MIERITRINPAQSNNSSNMQSSYSIAYHLSFNNITLFKHFLTIILFSCRSRGDALAYGWEWLNLFPHHYQLFHIRQLSGTSNHEGQKGIRLAVADGTLQYIFGYQQLLHFLRSKSITKCTWKLYSIVLYSVCSHTSFIQCWQDQEKDTMIKNIY